MERSVNIFDGMRNAPVEQQSLVAGLLKGSHTSSVLGAEIVSRTKWFQRKLGMNVPHVSFLEQIELAKKHFAAQSSSSRIDFIIAEVARRCKYDEPGNEEYLTYVVMQAIARKYKIEPTLAPQTLALRIGDAFLARMNKEFREYVDKATPEQLRKLDEQITENFDKLSERDKVAIKTALQVDNLNAKTVRNMVLGMGSSATPVIAVNALGFGAYIALSTIIHAVFTSLLGITVPFTVYMGMSSALATVSGPLAPFLIAGGFANAWVRTGKQLNSQVLDTTLSVGLAHLNQQLLRIERRQLWLPSGNEESEFKRDCEVIEQAEQDVRRLEVFRIDNDEQITTAKSEKDLTFRQIAATRKQIEQAKNKVADIEKGIANNTASMLMLQTGVSQGDSYSTAESNKLNAKIERLTSDLECAVNFAIQIETEGLAEIETLRNEGIGKDKTIAELTARNQKLEVQKVIATEPKTSVLNKREKELRLRYSKTMKNLDLNNQVFEWLSKQLDLNIVTDAESALLELNASNFADNNRGKMHGSGYLHVSFGQNDAYRIYFSRKGKIYIGCIGHKNSQKHDEKWLGNHQKQISA